MKHRGESDLRNKALMKIFNLIRIGERIGNGVPELFNFCYNEGWKALIIKEQFSPDRITLLIEFKKKQPLKTSNNMEKIREYLRINNITTTDDLAEYLHLSSVKTRAILSEMDDIDALGGKYHVVFAPKYRRKVFHGDKRIDINDIRRLV